MADSSTLLLIGHGSSAEDTESEMEALCTLLRERVDTDVHAGWIQAAPYATDVAAELVAADVGAITAVPLLLLDAYHNQEDVPAAMASVPEHLATIARPLGNDPRLVQLAADRIDAGAANVDGSVGLLLITTGTSSEEAQRQYETLVGEVAAATTTDFAAVQPAYVASAVPDVATAVKRLAATGVTTIVLFSWSLLAGILYDLSIRQARRALPDGVTLRIAGRIGPAPAVADVLADRYRAANA